MTEIEKFYSVKELAELLKLHTATLKGWIYKGAIPATKFGRAWRVSETDVKALLKNGFPIEAGNTRKVGRPKGGSLISPSPIAAAQKAAQQVAEAHRARKEAEEAEKVDIIAAAQSVFEEGGDEDAQS